MKIVRLNASEVTLSGTYQEFDGLLMQMLHEGNEIGAAQVRHAINLGHDELTFYGLNILEVAERAGLEV